VELEEHGFEMIIPDFSTNFSYTQAYESMIYEESGLGNEFLAGSIGSINIMVIITWNELGGEPGERE
jgi:hypothetical protein